MPHLYSQSQIGLGKKYLEKAPRTTSGKLQSAKTVSTSADNTSQASGTPSKDKKKKKKRKTESSMFTEGSDLGPKPSKKKKEEEPAAPSESPASTHDGPYTNRDSDNAYFYFCFKGLRSSFWSILLLQNFNHPHPI